MGDMIAGVVGTVIGLLIIGIVLGLFFAFPVMWIWNSVLVSAVGVQSITWFQAWLIMVFARFVIPTNNSSSN